MSNNIQASVGLSNMNISTFDATQTVKYAMTFRGMTATMKFKRED